MAGSSIRGITIQLGADASGITKTLGQVNTQAKNLQKELRQVDNALKLNPSSTELLKQKQELLAKAVTDTKDKLTGLQAKQDEMKKGVANWEQNKTAIEKNTKEISNTEKQLQSLKKEQDNAQKAMETGGQAERDAYEKVTQEVKKTEDKLKDLNEEQGKLQKSTVSPEQYTEYQREVEKTKGELNKATEAQKEFGNVVTQKMDQAGQKVEDLGDKFKGLSLAADAVLAGSVKSAMELDEGYDTIITKTGATGDKLNELQGVADNLFTSMPVDMADVGTAVGELNTRFGLTGDELEDTSRKFLEFANINGTDVDQSIQTVSKAMAMWNLDSSQSGEVLDYLTKVSQDTGISVDVLSQNLQTNGTYFQEMGLSVSDSITLMGEFEKHGVDTGQAMQGLKKACKNYTDQGMSMDEALQATVDSIKNNKDETAALQEAYEVFGAKGGATMYKAIKDGSMSLDDMKTSLSDYSGTVDKTFKETQDPWDEMKTTMNNVKSALSELGTAFLEALKPAIDDIVTKVKDVVKWFKSLDDGTKQTIAKITALVGALAPVLVVVGKLSKAFSGAVKSIMGLKDTFSKISGVVKKVGEVFGKLGPKISKVAGVLKNGLLNGLKVVGTFIKGTMWPMLQSFFAFLMANPIILIIAGIVAFIAAIVLLYKKCKWFRDICDAILSAIVGFFKSAWDMIVGCWEAVQPFFANLWNNIVAIFSGVVDFFAGIFQGAWDVISGIFSFLGEFFQVCWDAVVAVFDGVVAYYTFIFTTAWNVITGIFSVLGSFFQGCWDAVVAVFSVVGSFFSNIFTGAWNGIKNVFSGVGSFFGSVWQAIQNCFSGVASWFQNIFSVAWTAVKNVFCTGGQIFAGLVDGIANTFKSVVNTIISGINNVIAVPFDAINGLLNDLRTVDVPVVGQIFKGLWKHNPLPVPQIPQMAQGGWVDKATLALIGEGKEPEIVAPESKMKKVMMDALFEFGNNGSNGSGNSLSKETINNVTINNNSKYTSPAENARLLRKTLNSYKMKESY